MFALLALRASTAGSRGADGAWKPSGTGPTFRFANRSPPVSGSPQSGEKIMASMGSLGHYMQETSRAGFRLRDFLHEGNGDIWLAALARGPQRVRRVGADRGKGRRRRHAGDARARAAAFSRRILARVRGSGGLALYKRTSATTEVTENKRSDPEDVPVTSVFLRVRVLCGRAFAQNLKFIVNR